MGDVSLELQSISTPQQRLSISTNSRGKFATHIPSISYILFFQVVPSSLQITFLVSCLTYSIHLPRPTHILLCLYPTPPPRNSISSTRKTMLRRSHRRLLTLPIPVRASFLPARRTPRSLTIKSLPPMAYSLTPQSNRLLSLRMGPFSWGCIEMKAKTIWTSRVAPHI